MSRDRRDGKRVTNINGMSHIMYHLGKKRSENEVYINYDIDVTDLVKYVCDKNKNSDVHVTYFHVFVTAIGKVIYNRPLLNRFIVNGYFYDRRKVQVSYVAKTSFKDKSQELMKVLDIKEGDNLDTLSLKISKDVNKIRSSSSSGTDDLVTKIGNMPRFARGMIVSVFKFLDKHDMLPSDMTKEILYYSSVIVSNLGSIDCKDAIYHHLSEMGTNSVIITIGKINEKQEIINGKVETRSYCNFGVTLDERIADGFYFIKAIKLLEYILNNPILLEEDANAKVEVK
mgnify:FL=1